MALSEEKDLWKYSVRSDELVLRGKLTTLAFLYSIRALGVYRTIALP